ncbi:peptide ABC transporter substrate-binding protein [Cellulomonas algicola]|uniref:Peptide ABC transporter substrate-binding protein n=1 Tax=Cellulomonas algicola TaxID=2071633 RepID=A0A401V182_9CELL|nr:ABC transporter substrate-binding protein [Cellulomonas algicola]GCD20666.1 peptide ABC transporter substrate-binding protein [Cellulomonas algicola]
MRTRKLATMVAGVATVALLATACSGGGGTSDDGTGGDGAVLTVGMPNGPQNENQSPLIPTGSAAKSLGYAWVIYESLMQVNDVNPLEDPEPWLAESVEWNDDYTAATITPRDGVKWSDGEDFTADDVAFTLQLLIDYPAINNNFPDQIDKVENADGKVTITFTESQYVNQVKLLQQVIVPEHLWKDEDPTTFTDTEPVGTGPYLLDTWTPQAATLVPNPDYWGGEPKVAKLQYSSYNDNNALTTALTTGEAQWGWTFIADYEDVFIAKDPDHHHQVAGGGFGSDILYLNNETKPFDDVAFRKALNLVVDRAQISELAGSGVWPVIYSVTGMPMPSGEQYLAPEFKGDELKVDVDEAKQILTDAGYTWNGSDKLVDPDGEVVTFELVNPAGWNDYLTALDLIKTGAAQLGVDATVNAANQDAWFDDIIPFGNFQATLHWTDGGATPWNMYANLMDGNSYVPLGETATWNFGRYKNDAVTQALADFKGASDDAARQTAIETIQKAYVEDVPGLVIWSRPAVAQYSTKNYTGFPTADDLYANPQPTGPQAARIVMKLEPTQD